TSARGMDRRATRRRQVDASMRAHDVENRVHAIHVERRTDGRVVQRGTFDVWGIRSASDTVIMHFTIRVYLTEYPVVSPVRADAGRDNRAGVYPAVADKFGFVDNTEPIAGIHGL